MDDLTLTEEDIRDLFEQKKKPPPPVRPPAPPTPVAPPRGQVTPPRVPEPHGTVAVPPSPYQVQGAAPEFPTTDELASGHPAPLPPRPVAAPIPSRPMPAPPSVTVAIPAKGKYHSRGRRLTRALLTFLASFVLTFWILNAGTYFSRLNFWWATDIQGREQLAEEPVEPPTAVAANPLPANRIFIPKIGIEAPIIWDSPPNRVLQDLRQGVAHYQGTARPNDRAGNTFITGHSSGYPWDPGQYKTVFATLDKLVVGDLVALTSETNRYLYRVKDQKVVRPTELSVLDQTSEPILSLMTCTPVGTNLRRLIVRADLIDVESLSRTDRNDPLAE